MYDKCINVAMEENTIYRPVDDDDYRDDDDDDSDKNFSLFLDDGYLMCAFQMEMEI